MRYQEFLGLRTDRVPVLVETANDIDIARFRRKPVRIRKLVLASFSAKVSVRSPCTGAASTSEFIVADHIGDTKRAVAAQR